jgi:hypothetical protein
LIFVDLPNRVARKELDYYPTPRSAVDPIIPHLPAFRTMLDPACGVGELFDACPGNVRRFGIELDPLRAQRAAAHDGAYQVTPGNALHMAWPRVEAIIGNPPFCEAEAFVRKGLAEKHPRATMAMLLRLSFLEPTEPDPKAALLGRGQLHRKHPPDVYVLGSRPNFALNKLGKPGTDSVTAAWFVYGPGRGGRVFWL